MLLLQLCHFCLFGSFGQFIAKSEHFLDIYLVQQFTVFKHNLGSLEIKNWGQKWGETNLFLYRFAIIFQKVTQKWPKNGQNHPNLATIILHNNPDKKKGFRLKVVSNWKILNAKCLILSYEIFDPMLLWLFWTIYSQIWPFFWNEFIATIIFKILDIF